MCVCVFLLLIGMQIEERDNLGVCPEMLVFSELEVNLKKLFHPGFLMQRDFLAALAFHLPYRQCCLVVVALFSIVKPSYIENPGWKNPGIRNG